MVAVLLLEAAQGPNRLAVLIHHLAIDSVSWQILLPDLARLCESVAAEGEPHLDPVATSFARWAQAARRDAVSIEREREMTHWEGVLSGSVSRLGVRELDPVRDVARAARSLRRALSPEDTRLLLEVPRTLHLDVQDVLLAALWMAVAGETGEGGAPAVLVEVESYGRQSREDLDLSRTVGWFTAAFPLRLDPGSVDWPDVRRGGPTVGKILAHVQAQTRAVPDRGIGFGLLRYLNQVTARRLASRPAPEIGFNYLGAVTSSPVGGWHLVKDIGLGGAEDPLMPMAHVLDFHAAILAGPDGRQLWTTWTWPNDVVTAQSVQRVSDGWARAVDAVLRYASQLEPTRHTPSDLELVTLTQEEIDALEEYAAQW